MLQIVDLEDEIRSVLRALPKSDRALINVGKAREAFALILQRRARSGIQRPDRLEAIRNAITELHIAAMGQQLRRQKIFGAYWRLLLRLLNRREHATRPHVRRIRRRA